jgi:hypothetical protein
MNVFSNDFISLFRLLTKRSSFIVCTYKAVGCVVARDLRISKKLG